MSISGGFFHLKQQHSEDQQVTQGNPMHDVGESNAKAVQQLGNIDATLATGEGRTDAANPKKQQAYQKAREEIQNIREAIINAPELREAAIKESGETHGKEHTGKPTHRRIPRP